LNQTVLADWTATDDQSGIASAVGTVPSGSPIDTGTVGTKTFSVTATDNAGNQTTVTVTYSVGYAFGGFLPPLGPGPRSFKAGSTIPVKFQLTDAGGIPISSASGTASIDTAPGASAACRSTATQYIANLKIPKNAVVPGSYTITVTMDDGVPHTVVVDLK
jgi:hypothetical protein